MKGKSKFLSQLFDFITNIRSIKAKVLFFLFCWLRSLCLYAFKSWTGKLDIMAIGTISFDGERDAATVRKDAALRAAFCPVRRIWTYFFSRQVGLL